MSVEVADRDPVCVDVELELSDCERLRVVEGVLEPVSVVVAVCVLEAVSVTEGVCVLEAVLEGVMAAVPLTDGVTDAV